MNKIINETMNKIDEKDTLEATVPKLYKDLNPTVKEKLTNALYGSMNTPQYIEKFSERHPELKITDVIDCVNMSKDLETKLQFIEKFIDQGYTLGGAKTLIDLALDYSLDTDNCVTDNNMPGKALTLRNQVADNILFLSELTYRPENSHKVPQSNEIGQLIYEIDQTLSDNDISDVGIPHILREMEDIYLADKKNFVFSRALQLVTNSINTEYLDVETRD